MHPIDSLPLIPHFSRQDRRQITMGDLIEPLPPTDLTQAPIRPVDEEEEDLNDLRSGSSAKIDQLVHLLKMTPYTEKALVFSQFTGFRDKVNPTFCPSSD